MDAVTKRYQQLIAIHFGDTTFDVVWFNPVGVSRKFGVCHRTVHWRFNSQSILDEDGQQELTKAITNFLRSEKLPVGRLAFTLGPEYCTTKTLWGTKEEVHGRIVELEHRSQRYVTLGPGMKLVVRASTPMDGRHELAVVATVNRSALEAFTKAAQQTGFKLERAEPATVAMSRLLHIARKDAKSPQMYVVHDESGVTMAASFKGNLLVDFTPRTLDTAQRLTNHLAGQIARLERLCGRWTTQLGGLADAKEPSQLFVIADEQRQAEFKKWIGQQRAIKAPVMDMFSLHADWSGTLASKGMGPHAALGCLVGTLNAFATGQSPNFLAELAPMSRKRLLPELSKAGWPVLSAIAASLVLAGAVFFERRGCRDLEARLAALDDQRGQFLLLTHELQDARLQTEILKGIKNQCTSNLPAETLEYFAKCLPDTVWLKSVACDPRGDVRVSGLSLEDEGIFEFARSLSTVPNVSDVQIEGTQAIRFEDHLATQFDVSLNLSGYVESGHDSIQHD